MSRVRSPYWPFLCNLLKVDHYGNCVCGTGAELINESQCGCPDGLVVDAAGSICYDGIDSTFDQTQFTCETDETDALLEMLGYKFGLDFPERFGVDCDTFGYPVMQADYVGGVQGTNSGIQPALRPSNWDSDGVMSATISYEVFLPEEHEFIQNQFLPGFYHDGPTGGYRLARIKMTNGNLEMHTSNCDFCADVNAGGSLGTMTTGEWHKIELRLKLNDLGASNGEFLFFFNDQLTSHMTGMSLMVPDDSYAITHSRFWVFNNWPSTANDGSIYFKNYYITKFSSETTSNVFTTAAPTEAAPTTHPITTTTQPGIPKIITNLKISISLHGIKSSSCIFSTSKLIFNFVCIIIYISLFIKLYDSLQSSLVQVRRTKVVLSTRSY